MSNKISVIIPIYNGEKYLARCLDSLQRQMWQNIEFLLIDDGSKDGSAAICRRYADKDNRFQYYYKENGGVSSARNLGLDLATGDYIGFCDCDDWVDDDYYEYLFDLLSDNDADIAITSFVYETNEASRNTENGPKMPSSFRLNSAEAISEMGKEKVFAGHITKMFSKSVCGSLKFREDICLGEDTLFFTGLFLRTNKIVFDNGIKYHYFVHESSATHTSFSDKSWSCLKAYADAYEMTSMIPSSYRQFQLYPILRCICGFFYDSCKQNSFDKKYYFLYNKYLKKQLIKGVLPMLTFKQRVQVWFYRKGYGFVKFYCVIEPLFCFVKKIIRYREK